jgi:hypothetical protein
MDFIASQLTALASITGGYGITFVLAGLVTYLVTAYFGYVGQKTVCQVNGLSPYIEQIRKQFSGESKAVNRALLDLYARKSVNVYGFLLGLVPFRLLAAKAIDVEARSTQKQCLKKIYRKRDSNICLGRVCDSASRRYALLVDLRDTVRDAAVCCVSACVIGLYCLTLAKSSATMLPLCAGLRYI